MPASIATLTRLIDNEIIRAMGLPADGWLASRLHASLQQATRRFSEIFAEADHIVEQHGLPAGAAWLLRRLAADFQARGVETIPPEGPLLLAANHPGTIDSVTVAATAGRPDLKIVASALPFLQSLPNIRQHLIFTPRLNMQARMITVRESIRHLRAGGALLVFAHGKIDPDPDCMPDAPQELGGWSRSLEIFLRAVPEARVAVGIVSGVLDPAFLRHPITLLRRARRERQLLAMMMQMIEQMRGRRVALRPRVSYETLPATGADMGTPARLEPITERAQLLMRSHMAWHR